MKTQPFQVIPVIDVRHGQAVHAVAGDRANYQPLISPLCPDADPGSLASGYRKLFEFKTLYVADLDGIEGRGANLQLISKVSAPFETLCIWFDGGLSEPALSFIKKPAHSLRAGIAPETLHLYPPAKVVGTFVIGSETNVTGDILKSISAEAMKTLVLSLDFKKGAFDGDRSVLEIVPEWNGRIIVMTLDRVGTNGGPDLARLIEIIGQAKASRGVFAAGGIRNLDDLKAVRDAGASGALIASALHAGQIKTGDLEEIAG
jgi:HisA/HisF family protein